MGVLVGAVQAGGPSSFRSSSPAWCSSLLQVLAPIHQAISANLGDRTAAWLYDRLTEACVRRRAWATSRIRSSRATSTVARDFDLGMTGPPLSISMDFIAGGLVEMIGGLASCAGARSATRGGRRSLLAGAWLATHWLLRESAVWRDRNTDEVRAAQRDADYAYRLAVDPPAGEGAAAVRPRRLDDRALRRAPHAAARAAVRGDAAARAAAGAGACCSSSAANVLVFWSLARGASSGRLDARRAGRLRAGGRRRVDDRVRRAQLGARRRGGAGRPRCCASRPRWRPAGALAPRRPRRATACPAREIRFRDVTFAYPGRRAGARALRPRRFPPDRRSRSSGRTAPARRRSPSCSAGSTTRRRARSRSTASTCASSTLDAWRARVTAVFQDFIRFELPLRDNVAPDGAPDDVDRAALEAAGASAPRRPRHACSRAATTAAPISRAASGSASRWRARCARCSSAPGVVLLDEPTAQLDVRGEAEIFDRILRRHAPLHDDPDLAPLLDRAPRRPHLRARARPRGRARARTTS